MEIRVSPAIPCVHHEHVHASAATAGLQYVLAALAVQVPRKISVRAAFCLLPFSSLRVIYLLNKRSERLENLN